MALDFPNGPYTGQLFSDAVSGDTWKYDGVKWEGYSGSNTGGGGDGGTPAIDVGPGLSLDKTTTPWLLDVATPYLPLSGGQVTGNLYVTSEVRVGDTLRLDDSFYPFTEQWKWYAKQGDIYLWNNNNNLISMKANWNTGIVSFPMGVQSTAWVFYDATFPAQQWQWAAHDGFAYLNFNNTGFDPLGWTIGVQYSNGDVFTHFNLFVQQNLTVQGYAVARTWRILDYTQTGQYWEWYASGAQLRLRSDAYADWLTIDHTTGAFRVYSGIESTSYLRFYDPYYANQTNFFEWYASQGRAYLASNYGSNNYTTLIYIDYVGGIVHFPSGAESKAGWWVTDQTFDGGNPPTNPKPFQQWQWLANNGFMYFQNNNTNLTSTTMWGIEWATGAVFVGHDFQIFGNLNVQGTGTSAGWIFLDTSNRNNSWQWRASGGYARLFSSFYSGDYITINQNGGTLLSQGGIQTNSNFTFYDPFYSGLSRWFSWWASQGTSYLTSNYQGAGSTGFGATILISIDWVGGIVHFPSGAESKAGFWVTDQNPSYPTQQWHWYANGQATYLGSNGPKGVSLSALYTTGEVFSQYNLYAQQNFIVQGTGQTGQGWIFLDRSTPMNSWQWYATGGYARLFASYYGSDYLTINQNGGTVLAQGGFETNSHFTFFDPFYANYARSFTWFASQGTAYFSSNYQGAGSAGFGATVMMSFDWTGGIVHFPSGAESKTGFYVTDQVPAYSSQQWHWYATGQAMYLSSNSAKGVSLSALYTTGEVFSQYNLYAQQNFTVQLTGTSGQGWIFLDRVSPSNSWTLYASGGFARLYSSYYGSDYLTINQNGGIALFQGGVRTNSHFQFFDPFYANYARWFTWFASQGTAYLSSNYQGAGSAGFGATVLLSFDWTGGLVHFPSGAESVGGFYVTDQTFPAQQWHWYASGQGMYLASNGTGNWSIAAQYSNGDVFIQHDLYAQQHIIAQSDITSSSALYVRSRTTPTQVQGLIAHDGVLAFWFDSYGDYVTIDRNGGKVLAQGLFETNAGFKFDDPFYANYTRFWEWYAVQGVAYLSSNSNAAGGGVIAMQADWTTGLVTFPHGLSVASYNFTDTTFGTQTWKWWAHGGMAYLSSSNTYDWTIGIEYNSGNVFINKRLYLYTDVVLTAGTSAIYFINDGGTFLQVDSTNWALRLGANNGAFYFQRHDGSNNAWITSLGGAVFMGTVETNTGFTFDDPFYANRTHQWQWYAVQNTAHLGNNSGGGVDCILVDYTTGIVSFPRGITVSAFVYYDSTFTTQQWKLWAHDGFTYLEGNGAGSWALGAQYSNGNVFIRTLLYSPAISITGNYLYFANSGGSLSSSGNTMLYGDTNWIVAKPGSGNYGFMLYDNTGNMRVQLRADGTVLATGIGSSFGQFHMSPTNGSSGYGSMWYNDGGTTYLLLTNNNDALGGFNVLRPFAVANSNGLAIFGHGVVLANNTWLWGRDTAGTQQPLLLLGSDNAIYIGDNSRMHHYRSNNHQFEGGDVFSTYSAHFNSGFYTNARDNAGITYCIYGNAGALRIWANNVGDFVTFVQNGTSRFSYAIGTSQAYWWWDTQYTTQAWQWYAQGGWGRLWSSNVGDVIQVNWSTGLVQFPTGITSYGGWYFNDVDYGAQYRLWAHGHSAFLDAPAGWAWAVQESNSNVFIHFQLYCQQDLIVQWSIYQTGQYHFFNGSNTASGDVNSSAGPLIYMDGTNAVFKTGGGNGSYYFRTYQSGTFCQIDPAGVLWLNNIRHSQADGGYVRMYRPDGNFSIQCGSGDACNYYDNSVHRLRDRNSTVLLYVDGSSLTYNNFNASKQGGGEWNNSSDVRLKEEIADYCAGLKELLLLRPVTYKFNGRGGMVKDGRTYVGLVANEAVKSMPEMVSSRRGRLDPGDGEDTDILTLDLSALKLAVLNALREIDQRLTRLEDLLQP